MAPPVGFLLLTHANPPQVLRLARRLDVMFDHPPLVVHHDFSQCAMPENEFPVRTRFVRPYVRTAWGRITVVDAAVSGLKTFLALDDPPEWIVMLSGADYPIKPASRVIADLRAGDFDAHIRANLIERRRFPTAWHRKCFQRYCTTQLAVPSVTRTLRPRRRLVQLWVPFYTPRRSPFHDGFRCYAGPQWFCMSRRAAEYVVHYYDGHPELRAHYSRIYFPEESYFQTVLANASDLHVNRENDWRFVDIGLEAQHPKVLTTADLPALTATDAHFARKFNPRVDAAVLDELDRLTG